MRRQTLLLVLAPLLLGKDCLEDADVVDRDGDGFNSEEDCDDDNVTVFPGAPELCDGIDHDCDGDIPEGAFTWADADDDGWGDPLESVFSCGEPPQGFATNSLDCDDADPSVNPAAAEVCDGVDNDCDGLVDAEDLPSLGITCYEDNDGDGFGGPVAVTSCGDCLQGTTTLSGDCNDDSPFVYPGAPDVEGDEEDSDCDGFDCTVFAVDMTDFKLCTWSGTAFDWFAEAAAQGGRPATFTNAAEYGTLQTQLRRSGNPLLITGLYDGIIEGVWQDWTSGEVITYLPWADGEPNNSNDDEHCAAMQEDYGGLLNDVPCTFSFNGVAASFQREVPHDWSGWVGREVASLDDGCSVSWATFGVPAQEPPAGCLDCAFVMEVTATPTFTYLTDSDDCRSLAQPFVALYGYGLSPEGDRALYVNRAFQPTSSDWEAYSDAVFGCDVQVAECTSAWLSAAGEASGDRVIQAGLSR